MSSRLTLISELRELIAASSSTASASAPDSAHLEVKLREVIPNLLRAYVVPSPNAADKEKEVTAVLKLVAYTALKIPGVFYQGRAADIINVIGRILPFLAEPYFRSIYDLIFNAVWNLLSVLRTGDREAYRQFFLDAMVAVEDVLYVASIHDESPSGVPPGRFLVKCLCGSFSDILDSPGIFCQLPASCQPMNGPGVLVDLTGDARWRPFATSLLKLVNKCLTDGTLYVDGLVNMPFVSAACSILCYGDETLHKVCFDFARIVATVMTVDILPIENIIRSITCILSQDVTGVSDIRDADYDFSMGACLRALHSSCPGYIVESTAADIVNVLQRAVKTSKSAELQVAMYTAYKRIIELCSPQVWKPEVLLKLLCLPKPCSKLIECIRVVIDKFGPNIFTLDHGDGRSSPQAKSEEFGLPEVGQKRTAQNEDNILAKRQKINESRFSPGIGWELEKYSGNALQVCLNSLIKCLSPEKHEAYPLDPETAIEVLSLLCISLCVYPKTSLFTRISKQVLSWISWIHTQMTKRKLFSFDVSRYLEALHTVMLFQFYLPGHTKLFEDESQLIGDSTDFLQPMHADLVSLLKLMWDDGHIVSQTCSDCNIKCLLIQVISKIGNGLNAGCDLEFLDLVIHNGTAEIQNEALMSLPIIVLYSGPRMLGAVFKKLEAVGALGLKKVGKSIAFSLGFLSCLNGTTDYTENVGNHCKLFLDTHSEQPVSTLDLLLSGFWCSECDVRSRTVHNVEQISIVDIAPLQVENVDFKINISKAHSLFFKFLYAEASEECIVSVVEVLPRVLRHSSRQVLLETRIQWVQCVEFLLLHEMKAVREAFSGVICCFLEKNAMDILFSDGLETNGGTKELQFMDKIKHAFAEAEDSQILLTLLESIGTIMKVSGIHGEVFFCSFILLIDQLDNHNSIIRMTALRLIHRCCTYCFKGGLDLFLSKYLHVRDNLYNYLSSRLVTHPIMIKEFAEDVVGIKTKELIKRMVPSVIPKLIVSHRNHEQAVITLRELASHLNTELVPLIVNLLPKVLCFALFYENGQHVPSVLEFYKTETGTDSKEIFSAALPTLLDEIVCFPGESDQIETDLRTARISPTIQNIARILTGNDTLPEFLRNDFVRLLNSIDKKMLHSDDLKLQKQALQRIRKLVEMMGPYLSTHAPKIMVLLIFAIDKETLQMDGLDVLHFFIKQLAEVSPNSIKYVMSQVVAAFIPSLERCRGCPSAHLSKIVEILEELVVKNNRLLKQHIRELPLLPSLPSLSEVNKVIQEARGLMTLQDHLKDAVGGLNHESLNVRYMVACELSKLFNAKREDITALIVGEDVADLDVISSLIMALLKGCAEQSRTVVGQRLKLVCADCLGALGAVDPAKFKVISSERFKIECSDDDLIFELIHKHLARAFRAASDTTVQDSAALAIQELLKLAGCQSSPNESNSKESGCSEMSHRGQKLWGRFSNYVKEITAPCLTSRFHLPNTTDSALVGPIYRSAMSFRRWIYYWIRKLTSHATGSRSDIFTACRGIVRHDMPTAIYLLPYLVLNVVCYGTPEARKSITEEILCVLNAAASESSGAAVHGITGGQSEVCIQAIFTLLDNLGQWVDDLRQEIALSQSSYAMAGKHVGKLKDETSDYAQDQMLVQCNNVAELLAAIPKVSLARASLRCQAHARALMYFESHVREKSGSSNPAAEFSGSFLNDDISFLMEIYGGLDEPDGLLGLANLRKSSCLQDQLIINEKAGNWAEVLTLCEQALQMEPTSVHRHSDVLNCLLNMCHLQAMIAHVDGLVCSIPQYKKTWCMQGVQAAWRLGRWDLMDEYLTGTDKGLVFSGSENNASFDMDLAKIFKAMMIKDQFMVAEKIAQSKQSLLVPLAAAGMDSYMRAYPYVAKLHMLRELEDFNSLLGDESFLDKSFSADDPMFLKLTKDWENRLRCTQPSLWTREPLLALRRMVFSQSHMNSQVGNCWLQYAKLCRLAGHYETAHLAILEADASGAPNAHMEKAKYLWNIRKFDSAIAELQQTLLNMPAEVLGTDVLSSLCSLSLALPNAPISATQASKQNPDVSKTLLLYTRWIHYTGQKQSADIKSLYKRVIELCPKWEKGFFCMAKFIDDLLIDARKRQEDEKFACGVGPVPPSSSSSVSRAGGGKEQPWWDLLPVVIQSYGRALHKGHKNLFQALPRMLTLWFEFGSLYIRDGSSSDKPMKETHTKVSGLMRGCLKDLPTYQWLTVLSQLISRICHQNTDVVRIVKLIITLVLREYPQQALWMMAAVSKSTVPARRDAAAEILQSAKKGCRRGSENSALFIQFPTLIEHLIKLCFHPGQPKARTINISTEFSSLKRMMPLGIILPVQQALTVTLPSYDTNMSDQSVFHPFSVSEHPTIAGIADDAEILSSLQKPKKVVLLGSDGVARPFLCKPKDDLRKDSRMMEFNAMINRLLSKVPESRRRKLYIRTFAVVPLTEDCGMVEWVPNTRGLRHILQDIYITCGKFDRMKTNPQIKKIYDAYYGKMPDDEMLKTKILPMFPPVFHKWFLTTFSEPAAWFRARVAYAHTTAVWSMVGHIVGLGDRHGENILFDSTTGDCVHVDFSCLFDRGLLLDKPEVVPFRLTQNMIDGLGITGYEGVFLKVCEITLSVLRTHKETLMTVLETFIHDPLVEWTKSHKSSGGEVQNPHAQRAITNIKGRLQGVVVGVKASPSLPLSVEGQARRLIAEAVSLSNLGKMYIWWMPWF